MFVCFFIFYSTFSHALFFSLNSSLFVVSCFVFYFISIIMLLHIVQERKKKVIEREEQKCYNYSYIHYYSKIKNFHLFNYISQLLKKHMFAISYTLMLRLTTLKYYHLFNIFSFCFLLLSCLLCCLFIFLFLLFQHAFMLISPCITFEITHPRLQDRQRSNGTPMALAQVRLMKPTDSRLIVYLEVVGMLI